MKRTLRNSISLVKAVMTSGLITLTLAGAAKAEETIRAIAGFPEPLALTQSFLGFVAEVNRRGKGIVKIEYVGGPEVFPMVQQMDAVRRGVIDMIYGPVTPHLGAMPEADAWVGSNVSAADARRNGGFALMKKAFTEKLGTNLLAHLDSGIQFHIYTTDAPNRNDDGGVNLDGKRLRSQAIYQSFFESLGAVPITVHVPDVYTGLERNMFDGVGFPIVGIQDLSWDKFLKYRIDPGFFSTDLAVVMSPAKWKALSADARTLLTEVAIEYEQTSFENFQKMIATIDGEVQADGMTIVQLEGDAAAAYILRAHESAWSRMKEAGVEDYDALRAAYYQN